MSKEGLALLFWVFAIAFVMIGVYIEKESKRRINNLLEMKRKQNGE